jgi:hypothetical protein
MKNARDKRQKEIQTNLFLVQQWHLWKLPYFPSNSLSCVSLWFVCLYVMFVFNQQYWEEEGWESVMQYYYRSIQVPYMLPINVHQPDSVLRTP